MAWECEGCLSTNQDTARTCQWCTGAPCIVCGAPVDRQGNGHDIGCTAAPPTMVLWECRRDQCTPTHRLYTDEGRPWRDCCKTHGEDAASRDYGHDNGLVLESIKPAGSCADCGSPDVVDESTRGPICQPCVDVQDMENARDLAERQARDWQENYNEARELERTVARRRRDAAVAAAMANINRHKPAQP